MVTDYEIEHNGTTYYATVDSDDRVRVFVDGVFAGAGRVAHGEIVDVAIDLPDVVWDWLTAHLYPVS